jgi:glycosyltransferase involved in cell wall biosynthesis
MLKMHILILPSEHYVTQLAPLPAIFQYHQARALRKKGIKVGVVSAGFVPFKLLFSEYPYKSFEDEDGVYVYRHYKKIFVPFRIASKIFIKSFVGLYLKLFERYTTQKGLPDIIHAHNCLYAGATALRIKKTHKIPYVITEHSSAYERGLISSRQAKVVREVLKNADLKTVVGTKFGRQLENLFGEDASPIYPIFNILDDRFENDENIPKKINKNRGTFTFLNIARFDANKNQSDLLDAFAHIFQGNSKVQLKISGYGPLLKKLESHAKTLGIKDQVSLTGLLSRDRVLLEMQNCDVFILSSLYETFGVVIIEALACGKPVVATKCGGPEDIINKGNGILVPSANVDALAAAMSKIYSNIDKYDPNLIRSDCLSRFGQESFVKRLRRIYTSILENTG